MIYQEYILELEISKGSLGGPSWTHQQHSLFLVMGPNSLSDSHCFLEGLHCIHELEAVENLLNLTHSRIALNLVSILSKCGNGGHCSGPQHVQPHKSIVKVADLNLVASRYGCLSYTLS